MDVVPIKRKVSKLLFALALFQAIVADSFMLPKFPVIESVLSLTKPIWWTRTTPPMPSKPTTGSGIVFIAIAGYLLRTKNGFGGIPIWFGNIVSSMAMDLEDIATAFAICFSKPRTPDLGYTLNNAFNRFIQRQTTVFQAVLFELLGQRCARQSSLPQW